MKKLAALMTALLAGLVFLILSPTFSIADIPRTAVYREHGTVLDDVALNGAASVRTTTAVEVIGYNQLLFFVDFTFSAATSVSATCRANYDKTDVLNYRYLAWDCSSGTACTGTPWTWTYSGPLGTGLTDDDSWIIPVPFMGRQVTCIFSAVGATANDKLSVKLLGGVM
jgi:hypothetical protein